MFFFLYYFLIQNLDYFFLTHRKNKIYHFLGCGGAKQRIFLVNLQLSALIMKIRTDFVFL